MEQRRQIGFDMNPLRIKDGKILIVNQRLANSDEDCCCTCYVGPPWNDVCSCLDFNDAYFTVKMGYFPGVAPDPMSPVTPPVLDIKCGVYGPNCETGWLIKYNGVYDDPLNDPNAVGQWSLFISNLNCGCCPDLNSYTMNLDSWELDGGGEPGIPAPTITLTFYNPSSICDDAKCTPATWQLYDTTNQKVLDYGNITQQDETTYILENLETPFKPWGYYSKKFHVELRVYCVDDLEGETIWQTDVEIGSCGDNRYPTYPYDAPWTRKTCKPRDNPCLREEADVINISMNPGGLVREGVCDIYLGGVDNEYSNIFNWSRTIPAAGGWFSTTPATFRNLLPSNSVDVIIAGNVLSDASTGGAKCANLLIDGSSVVSGPPTQGGSTKQYLTWPKIDGCNKFGIKMVANGYVWVRNDAHIIDQKYNDQCNSRGHLVSNKAFGGVSISNNANFWNAADGNTYDAGTDGYGQIACGFLFTGNCILSGTLEYTGSDPLAAAFYNGYGYQLGHYTGIPKIMDNAIITGGQYIELYSAYVLQDNISSASNTRSTPTYDGKWFFRKWSVNYGTITTGQYVRFFDDSTNNFYDNNQYGIVTTESVVRFYDNSSNSHYDCATNKTLVTNDAEFYDNTFNSGKVGGNVEFYDSSYYICGTVVGSVDLYDSSYIDTNATLTNNNIELWDNSRQKGNIVSTNTVVFHDNAQIISGTLTGNASFLDTSSAWAGTIIGNCSFSNYAGCGAYYFSGSWTYNTSQSMIIKEGNTTFDNDTLNNGLIHVSSSKSCVFNGASVNDGGYVTSAVGVPSGGNNYSVIFNGTSRNGMSGSSRTSTVMGGNVTFNPGTGNGYPGVTAIVDGYNIVFNGTGYVGSVQNYGIVTGSNSVSMTYGYNNPSASITGPTTLTNSQNEASGTITGNTSFVSSKNYGTVNGDADFDTTSCNSGTVTGTITCGGGACNPGDPPTC